MNLRLQRATQNDSALMAEIIRAVFGEYHERLVPPSSAHKETGESVASKITKGGGIIACVGDAVAGCVVYYPDGDSLYLGRLAVIPAYRKHGIGRALVGAVEERAMAGGFNRVSLAVRLALPDNRAFFERLGYSVISYESHEGYSEPTFMILYKTLEVHHANPDS